MLTNLHISTEASLLDHDWLFRTLGASYWGRELTKIQLLRAIDNSLCFGVYVDNQAEQIGFARVITDRAIVSTVTDLIVGEAWRRQGVGRKLVEAVISHPWVNHTTCVLQTKHARALYTAFGFVSSDDVLKRRAT